MRARTHTLDFAFIIWRAKSKAPSFHSIQINALVFLWLLSCETIISIPFWMLLIYKYWYSHVILSLSTITRNNANTSSIEYWNKTKRMRNSCEIDTAFIILEGKCCSVSVCIHLCRFQSFLQIYCGFFSHLQRFANNNRIMWHCNVHSIPFNKQVNAYQYLSHKLTGAYAIDKMFMRLRKKEKNSVLFSLLLLFFLKPRVYPGFYVLFFIFICSLDR